jgi:ribosome maturation factor RimP
LADLQAKERTLQREVSQKVESSVPGTEVLALELSGPDRFTVFVDHPKGVDHALCARVTNVLRDYLRQYAIDVSSPGIERPLRKPSHFERAVGHRVQLRTATDIAGRKRFKGELKQAGSTAVTVGVEGADVEIPYDAIVRGNLVDER